MSILINQLNANLEVTPSKDEIDTSNMSRNEKREIQEFIMNIKADYKLLENLITKYQHDIPHLKDMALGWMYSSKWSLETTLPKHRVIINNRIQVALLCLQFVIMTKMEWGICLYPRHTQIIAIHIVMKWMNTVFENMTANSAISSTESKQAMDVENMRDTLWNNKMSLKYLKQKLCLLQQSSYEGKSLIIILLSVIIHKLCNKKVHIAYDTKELLVRDMNLYRKYFELTNVKFGKHNINDDVNSSIIFVLLEDIQSAYITKALIGKARNAFKNVVLIVNNISDVFINTNISTLIERKDNTTEEVHSYFKILNNPRNINVESNPPKDANMGMWYFAIQAKYLSEQIMYNKPNGYTTIDSKYYPLNEYGAIDTNIYSVGHEYMKFKLSSRYQPNIKTPCYIFSLPHLIMQYDLCVSIVSGFGSNSEKELMNRIYRNCFMVECPSYLSTFIDQPYKYVPTLINIEKLANHANSPSAKSAISGPSSHGTLQQYNIQHNNNHSNNISESEGMATEMSEIIFIHEDLRDYYQCICDFILRFCTKVPIIVVMKSPSDVHAFYDYLNRFLRQLSLIDISRNEIQKFIMLDKNNKPLNYRELSKSTTVKHKGNHKNYMVTITDEWGSQHNNYQCHQNEINDNGGILTIITYIPSTPRLYNDWVERPLQGDNKCQYMIVLHKDDPVIDSNIDIVSQYQYRPVEHSQKSSWLDEEDDAGGADGFGDNEVTNADARANGNIRASNAADGSHDEEGEEYNALYTLNVISTMFDIYNHDDQEAHGLVYSNVAQGRRLNELCDIFYRRYELNNQFTWPPTDEHHKLRDFLLETENHTMAGIAKFAYDVGLCDSVQSYIERSKYCNLAEEEEELEGKENV